MIRKFLKLTYILPLLVFTYSACKVGKDLQTPEPELPKQFGEVSYADTSSIADVEWKSFFTDPVLQDLIQKGITYNYDLQLAVKRIEIAQRQVQQSKNLQFPEVNLQVTAQYNRPSDNSLSGKSASGFLGQDHIENYLAITTVSWEADIWGK